MDDSSRKRLHDDAFNHFPRKAENVEDCMSNKRFAATCSQQNVEVKDAVSPSSEKASLLPSVNCLGMTSRPDDVFSVPVRRDVFVPPIRQVVVADSASVERRMTRPPSPVSVTSSFHVQHLCTTTDVDRVGRALVHRTRCKRSSCEICRNVDSLLMQVRDHKRRGCSGHGCDFCRKWTVVLHRSKRRLAFRGKRNNPAKKFDEKQRECRDQCQKDLAAHTEAIYNDPRLEERSIYNKSEQLLPLEARYEEAKNKDGKKDTKLLRKLEGETDTLSENL